MAAVIITGASSGLGLALSQKLEDAGRFVVGVARRNVAGRGNYGHVQGDVAEESTWHEVERVLNAEGHHVEMLINCAGIGKFGPPGTYSASTINSIVGSNFLGAVMFSERVIEKWRADEEEGLIVNILSTAAFTPRALEAVYCAAKAGLKMYTEAARLQLKGSGIRFLNIFPGGIDTPFWEESATDASKFMQTEEVADFILSNLSKGKTGSVTDITINRNS